MGQCSKRKNKFVWRIGNEEQALPRKSHKRFPRNWRIAKALLWREWPSSTSKIGWIVRDATEGSSNSESTLGSAETVTGKSEFLVWCERISWSWNYGQHWSVPRYQSTLNKSELQNCASPRFWIAAWNTQYDGYLRRFWTTTCSRRTTSKYLEKIKEFGIFFSWSETKTYRTYDDNRIEEETRATRLI